MPSKKKLEASLVSRRLPQPRRRQVLTYIIFSNCSCLLVGLALGAASMLQTADLTTALREERAQVEAEETEAFRSLYNSRYRSGEDYRHFWDAEVLSEEQRCCAFVSLARCRAAQAEVLWLISYPGSGNTWMRKVLSGITGIYTGSVYRDGKLVGAGMLGEGSTSSNRVFGVKSHGFGRVHRNATGTRLLFIVRHPLHAVASALRFSISHQHDKAVDSEVLKQLLGGNSLKGGLIKWRGLVETFAERKAAGVPALTVRYEDLVQDIEGTFRRQLAPFLGLDHMSPEGRMLMRLSMVAASVSKGIRRPQGNLVFTAQDCGMMQGIIGRQMLQQYNYSCRELDLTGGP